MTVIDLLEERAAREVPRYLQAFEHGGFSAEKLVFSSEGLAQASARELRRQIRRRDLHYSVTRRGKCVFLRNHAFWDGLEDELAVLLSALLRRTHAHDGGGQHQADAG